MNVSVQTFQRMQKLAQKALKKVLIYNIPRKVFDSRQQKICKIIRISTYV